MPDIGLSPGRQDNTNDVEAHFPVVVVKIHVCCGRIIQQLLLFELHIIFRVAVPVRLPRFHFDKNQLIVQACDEIDLSRTVRSVGFQNLLAFLFKIG